MIRSIILVLGLRIACRHELIEEQTAYGIALTILLVEALLRVAMGAHEPPEDPAPHAGNQAG